MPSFLPSATTNNAKASAYSAIAAIQVGAIALQGEASDIVDRFLEQQGIPLMKHGFGVWTLMIPLLLLCCSPKTERVIAPAFYYWKTTLNIPPPEQAYLNALGVQRLYMRLFDVDWNPRRQQAVPLASIELTATQLSGRELVPTVFLTNRTMLNVPESELGQLAQRIYERIRRITGTIPFQEIQLDCDWSPQSRDNFFQLINLVRAQAGDEGIRMSATIRLHQVKYAAETGVPPVDRGMLMFYNMDDVTDIQSTNSILNLETATTYLENFEAYPLPLDVALPLFSWGLVIRNEKTIHLLSHLRSSQLTDPEKFAVLEPRIIQVKKSNYLNGYYLYEGDVIRIEEVQLGELQEAAKMLAPLLPDDSLHISFYHLDFQTIDRYRHEDLETVLRLFR